MVYKDIIIGRLRELADEGFQRRVWLASAGSEVSSFTEAICGLHNDSGLIPELERSQLSPVFSTSIDERLRKLTVLAGELDQLLGSSRPDLLIEHPKMQLVRDSAAEILAQITADSKGK